MDLTVEAQIHNIELVTEFVNERLQAMGCSRRVQTQIDIALDELFSNICRYAYDHGHGTATIRIQKDALHNAVQITIEDKGMPFNPLEHEDPDVSLGLHAREIGGLGIFMVKRTMDDVRYEYRNGTNRLTVTKKL